MTQWRTFWGNIARATKEGLSFAPVRKVAPAPLFVGDDGVALQFDPIPWIDWLGPIYNKAKVKKNKLVALTYPAQFKGNLIAAAAAMNFTVDVSRLASLSAASCNPRLLDEPIAYDAAFRSSLRRAPAANAADSAATADAVPAVAAVPEAAPTTGADATIATPLNVNEGAADDDEVEAEGHEFSNPAALHDSDDADADPDHRPSGSDDVGNLW
jgi:hypothetical protein